MWDPASSKVDPPLPKAEPINKDGGSSVKMYLRNCKKFCIAAGREEWEYVRGMTLQIPPGQWRRRAGGAPDTRADIPLRPMEVRGGADIRLWPMQVHGGADIPLRPTEDPTPLPSCGRRLLSLEGWFENQTTARSLPGCPHVLPPPRWTARLACALLNGSASLSDISHVPVFGSKPRDRHFQFSCGYVGA